MRRAAGIAATALLVLIAGATSVLGDTKDIASTPHDLAAPGVSPCVYCHLPRDDGSELLWAGEPNAGGQFSGLKPLCFSCHDGTVTATGSYVFDTSRPQHLTNPGLKDQDCDRCHDPHEAKDPQFVKVPGAANFCQACHSRAGPTDHPIDVSARALGVKPTDAHWDPDSGDFSGTRLWNDAGDAPGDLMKCLTCHSPHGGQPNTEINTIAFNSSHESFLPICQNCHYGWGEQVPER